MERIQTITADQVDQAVEQNSGLLFVHFGSPLASSCEVVRQQLEAVAPLFTDRVSFAEVEIPLQDLDLIQRFTLETIPTLILFAGSEPVERLEHLMLQEELVELLEMATSFYVPPKTGGSDEGEDL